jgi:thymidylate kinase
MAHNVYIIEGLDRLGKSTLISNLRNKLGNYTVVHYGKPEKLAAYRNATGGTGSPLSLQEKVRNADLLAYQQESFRSAMLMARSGACLIYDRAWLGEAVYAPLYRGYSGDYVFDYELRHHMDVQSMVKLVLLTEDFDRSRHFVDDGESFDVSKRREEQELFRRAFSMSHLPTKIEVCVTAANGKFRDQYDILDEVLRAS